MRRERSGKIDAYVGQLELLDIQDRKPLQAPRQAKRAHVFSVLGVYWPPRR